MLQYQKWMGQIKEKSKNVNCWRTRVEEQAFEAEVFSPPHGDPLFSKANIQPEFHTNVIFK